MQWTMKTDPSGFKTRWCQELADRYLAEGHWTRPTLRDIARTRAAEDPGKVIIIEGENRLTRSGCLDQAVTPRRMVRRPRPQAR